MTPSNALIILPLAAAVLFAVSAITLKRSNHLGVGPWQTVFVANMVAGVCYSTLWSMGGPPVRMELLWQPALISLCMFSGMAFQFAALQRGDVSVAVPVLGLKVMMVAFVTPFLVHEAVGPALWVAALLSVLGVTCLNHRAQGVSAQGLGATILAGIGASVSFAVFDVLVQKWGQVWGAGRLLPCVFWMNALMSLGLFFKPGFQFNHFKPQAWKWLLGGSLIMSLQSILFVGCLAVYGKAAAANIIYSARGLLSVVLVWTIGHWFGSAEKAHGTTLLRWRLAGAALMLSAIVTAVAGK